MTSKNFSRRQLLRGTGVALSLPWLETFAPRDAKAAAASAPKRYISLYFPNGSADFWHPTGSQTSFTLSPILEPLTPNKSRLLVLGNVGNYSPWGMHVEPSHSNNCATAWTGVKANGQGAMQSGISIDQAIADQLVAANGGMLPTALHSLQVGLSTLDSYTDGLPGPHSRSISWKSASEPLYKIVSPQGVFDRIVGGGLPTGGTSTTPDPLAERRRQLKKSAIDYVLENATDLQKKLSTSDRARLDKYLTSARTLEQRVAAPGMQVVTPMACAPMMRPDQTFGVGNTPVGYDRGAHATLMIDLVVMAIQCDVTRVVSFMLDDARSDFVYDFLKERQFTTTGSTPGTAPVQGYHGLQHAGNTNNGFATITWWNADRANEIATKLAAITEGGAGNVMDNSVITFMSGMHGGNHDGLDLPIVLIGGGGGVLKMNQYIDFPGAGKNLQDMHLTILQKVFGSPLQAFGTPLGGYTAGIIPEILA